MEQHKIVDSAEAKKLASQGIECCVRCTSNKVDQAKDDIRSICLNFDIKGHDADGDIRNIGKGNNLNINNLTPSDYEQLCKLFHVNKIDEGTPIIAVLYHTEDYEQKQLWAKTWAREDKQLDENQADVTEFAGLETKLTEKQLTAIRKYDENEEAQSLIQEALKLHDLKTVEGLTKTEATELISLLKKKEKGDKPTKEAGNGNKK